MSAVVPVLQQREEKETDSSREQRRGGGYGRAKGMHAHNRTLKQSIRFLITRVRVGTSGLSKVELERSAAVSERIEAVREALCEF